MFDVVEEDGSPWIVMELVRARPLDQVIAEDGPLPPARAAQLGLGLLDALATAHKAGVLHRDVKPSNVLIRPDGKAVLTDFGIATIQGDPSLTQAGMVVGTPGFSPPERVRGTGHAGVRSVVTRGDALRSGRRPRPFRPAGGSAAIVASIATEPAPRAPSPGRSRRSSRPCCGPTRPSDPTRPLPPPAAAGLAARADARPGWSVLRSAASL